jgi:hypothetical protein
VEARQRLDVRAASHAHRLDHLAARAASRLGAERRALVAVELHHRQVEGLSDLCDMLERRVDEHARDLDPAPERRRDLGGCIELAPARRARPEDQPDRPRARVDGETRVFKRGDPAELDLRHPHIVCPR